MILAIMATATLASGVAAQQQDTSSCSIMLRESWQAVADVYLDESFRGVDWEALRPSKANSDCSDRTVHAAVRQLLGRLGDPAVRLVPAHLVDLFMADMTGQPVSGVGLRELLSVDVDESTRLLTVVTPAPDGPAAAAGIRTGDVIEAIGGIRVDTMDLALAMERLRGPPGTFVDVRIRRGRQVAHHRLQREQATQHTAEWRLYQGRTERLGYIRLPDFSMGSAEALRQVLAEAEESGAKGFVLDLRDNPGGLVPELTMAAEIFLAAGLPIARIRSRLGSDTVLTTTRPAETDASLFVLVNNGSASAAEALAGALQANGRAVVLGERTFGKGLAHFATELPDGSLVMTPFGRLHTPTGRDILTEGIAPDFVMPAPALPTLVPDLRADTLVVTAMRLLESSLPKRIPTSADSAAIMAAALDYIEGWYTGDGERMRRAVHPDLVKRIYLRQGGEASLVTTDGKALVEQTRQGHGRADRNVRVDVEILDVFQNSASVKIEAGLWVDYAHLSRTDQGWRIVNILWELR